MPALFTGLPPPTHLLQGLQGLPSQAAVLLGVLWMCFLSVSLLLFNNYNVKFLFVASRAVYCYASLVYCLLLFWISIYLFVLAVFGAQLNKTKHEVIGLTIVLVTPLFFVWVAPWTAVQDRSILNYSATSIYVFSSQDWPLW